MPSLRLIPAARGHCEAGVITAAATILCSSAVTPNWGEGGGGNGSGQLLNTGPDTAGGQDGAR